jgi:hypothetical protein
LISVDGLPMFQLIGCGFGETGGTNPLDGGASEADISLNEIFVEQTNGAETPGRLFCGGV